MTAGPRRYALVYAALILLLAATFAAARFELGPFNTVVALIIAWTKTILVVLYFMHLKDSPRLNSIVWSLGLVMLFIVLMGLTLADYFGRASSI